MQAAKERTQERFFVTTGADVSGRRITQVLGVVTAADVRSKNLLADVWTAFAGAFGGEAGYYTHLCNEASSAAADKAVHRAKELGADALVNVRFEVATTMNRLVVGLHATVVCYGTAVITESIEAPVPAASTTVEEGKKQLPWR